jgi:hypothetical protein
MNGTKGLLHELWEHTEDDGTEYTFCYAGPQGAAARRRLHAEAKLVWTVWAVSHFDAMARYYERQGWGAYTTDQPWDFEPYPVEWVQEQQQFFASSTLRESETLS